MPIDDLTRWVPHTSEDTQVVLSELNVMLSSHHFKNSKRYPALLSYVVEKALEGKTGHLKERTLGVEVFGRQPDYDTNADPIVRVTAGEIRKKIAQFYHDKGNEFCLQIDLPLGSYLPEFKRVTSARPTEAFTDLMPTTVPVLLSAPKGPGTVPPMAPSQAERANATWWNRLYPLRLWPTVSVIAIVAISCLSAYVLHEQAEQDAIHQFWKPLLSGPGSVLVVLPATVQRSGVPTNPDHAELVRLSHGPYNYISVCDAVALSRFANLLGENSKRLDIKEANLASLNDLHERSVVLVGAVNNHWTMRLTDSLRFHFAEEGTSVRIVDSQNPQNREWTVDYTKPYAFATRDYAIVARYRDTTTSGNVVVIAGIGAHATQAASEFSVTSTELEDIRRLAPRGWESRNLEMVIEADIINGDSGPPHLVAIASW